MDDSQYSSDRDSGNSKYRPSPPTISPSVSRITVSSQPVSPPQSPRIPIQSPTPPPPYPLWNRGGPVQYPPNVPPMLRNLHFMPGQVAHRILGRQHGRPISDEILWTIMQLVRTRSIRTNIRQAAIRCLVFGNWEHMMNALPNPPLRARRIYHNMVALDPILMPHRGRFVVLFDAWDDIDVQKCLPPLPPGGEYIQMIGKHGSNFDVFKPVMLDSEPWDWLINEVPPSEPPSQHTNDDIERSIQDTPSCTPIPTPQSELEEPPIQAIRKKPKKKIDLDETSSEEEGDYNFQPPRHTYNIQTTTAEQLEQVRKHVKKTLTHTCSHAIDNMDLSVFETRVQQAIINRPRSSQPCNNSYEPTGREELFPPPSYKTHCYMSGQGKSSPFAPSKNSSGVTKTDLHPDSQLMQWLNQHQLTTDNAERYQAIREIEKETLPRKTEILIKRQQNTPFPVFRAPDIYPKLRKFNNVYAAHAYKLNHGRKKLSKLHVPTITKMLDQEIITECHCKKRCTPRISFFTVSKPNGSARPIFDCSPLNELCPKPPKFRLPNGDRILAFLGKQNYQQEKIFASIDLSQAFHSVKMHRSAARYLTIGNSAQTFHMKGLPMGWAFSPFMLQSILRLVNQISEVKFIHYLDDLLVYDSPERIQYLINFLVEMGLTINEEKCEIGPFTTFLSYKIDNLKHLSVQLPKIHLDSQKRAVCQVMYYASLHKISPALSYFPELCLRMTKRIPVTLLSYPPSKKSLFISTDATPDQFALVFLDLENNTAKYLTWNSKANQMYNETVALAMAITLAPSRCIIFCDSTTAIASARRPALRCNPGLIMAPVILRQKQLTLRHVTSAFNQADAASRAPATMRGNVPFLLPWILLDIQIRELDNQFQVLGNQNMFLFKPFVIDQFMRCARLSLREHPRCGIVWYTNQRPAIENIL